MNDPLFCQRLRVGLADRLEGSRMAPEARLLALAALDGSRDLTEAQRAAFNEALDERDGPALLRLFWKLYASDVLLNPVDLRLLINPPPGIEHVNAQACFTLRTEKERVLSPGGSLYGLPYSNENIDLWKLARSREEKSEFFDDLTIFFDQGFDLAPIIDKAILPGTTVTLIRPAPDRHRFWLDWSGLNLSFNSTVLDPLSRNFTLRTIYEADRGEINVLMYGVEFSGVPSP